MPRFARALSCLPIVPKTRTFNLHTFCLYEKSSHDVASAHFTVAIAAAAAIVARELRLLSFAATARRAHLLACTLDGEQTARVRETIVYNFMSS